MKIEVELPDGTIAAFVNYIYHEGLNLMMGSRSIDGDDLEAGVSTLKNEEEE